ncbi:MAG TPA: hypothetical protein VN802_00220 [Stellaceae bacterium]|nr:hypothetical protein [Stellaceae bacterium]
MTAINLNNIDTQTAITAALYVVIVANIVYFAWLTKSQTNAKRRRQRLYSVADRARGLR